MELSMSLKAPLPNKNCSPTERRNISSEGIVGLVETIRYSYEHERPIQFQILKLWSSKTLGLVYRESKKRNLRHQRNRITPIVIRLRPCNFEA